jgi:diguanylate cyclase (GGDEF)-like protein
VIDGAEPTTQTAAIQDMATQAVTSTTPTGAPEPEKLLRIGKPCLLKVEPVLPLTRIMLHREETPLGPISIHRQNVHQEVVISIQRVDNRTDETITVDGEPLGEPRNLEDGQSIQMGESRYRFFLTGDLGRLLEDETFRNAVTDPITGCLSRDVLLDHLTEAYHDATEGAHPVSLVIFGVDDYPELQETGDRALCDHVLTRTADLIRQGLRQHDHLFHNQEHHFTLVLPHATAKALHGLGGRILKQVASSPVETPLGPRHVTLSAAIVTGPLLRAHADHLDFLAEGEALLADGLTRGNNRIVG